MRELKLSYVVTVFLFLALVLVQTYNAHRWKLLAEDAIKNAQEWRDWRVAAPDAFYSQDGDLLEAPIYAVFVRDGEIVRVETLSSRQQ